MRNIPPALSAEEWRVRRFGPVAIETVGEETQLVVRDGDGDGMSIAGIDEKFALMALANDALPDGDPRKFTVTDVAVCRLVMERVIAMEGEYRLHSMINQLCDKLTALLPTR